MNRFILLCMAMLMLSSVTAMANDDPVIEVSGSATLNIVPDRITVEIGIEEYFKPKGRDDSTLVHLADIEKDVRRSMSTAGISMEAVAVADVGNRIDRSQTRRFRMAQRMTATLTGLDQLDALGGQMSRPGIVSFVIVSMDNSEMEAYNRQGLGAALDAARSKANYIAAREKLTLQYPLEIVETTGDYGYGASMVSNVAFDAAGSGMGSMRRIARRYSVKVRYKASTATVGY